MTYELPETSAFDTIPWRAHSMDLNTLRDALHQVPFQPFTIRLADGRSEHVKHPEFVAVGPRIVVVVREDNSVAKIEPLLIVSLEEKGKDGDGKSRKKRRPM
jgi:hypothetical protein